MRCARKFLTLKRCLFVLFLTLAGCSTRTFISAPSNVDNKPNASIEDYILALPKFSFHEEGVEAFTDRIHSARSLPENKGKGRNYLYCPTDGCWPVREFMLDPSSKRLTIRVHEKDESPKYITVYQRVRGGWIREK